jgi:hypothetical protein
VTLWREVLQERISGIARSRVQREDELSISMNAETNESDPSSSEVGEEGRVRERVRFQAER